MTADEEIEPGAVPDLARYITLAQLCAGWQCSESSVRRRMLDGTVAFVRVGRLVRFPRELLESGPTAAR